MGQYYKCTFKDQKGNYSFMKSWDYDSGAKLIEHSYVCNDYVETAMQQLMNKKKYVAWVGDYADYEEDKNLNEGKFEDLIDIANKKENEIYKIRPRKITCFQNSLSLTIYNHTKKQFINMYNYVILNSDKPKDNNDYVLCFHPLPLLTAVGNGKGGGDYSGINESLIGYWAGDLISVGPYNKQWCNIYANITFEIKFKEGR